MFNVEYKAPFSNCAAKNFIKLFLVGQLNLILSTSQNNHHVFKADLYRFNVLEAHDANTIFEASSETFFLKSFPETHPVIKARWLSHECSFSLKEDKRRFLHGLNTNGLPTNNFRKKGYQAWLGQSGTTIIPEAFSFLIFTKDFNI